MTKKDHILNSSIDKKEYAIISFVLVILFILLRITGFDEILISPFFSHEKNIWPFQNTFVTEILLHKGGVKLVILIFIFFLVKLIISFKKKNSQKIIFFSHLLISALFSIVFITFLKSIMPFHCPWDLSEFGGKFSYLSLQDIFNFTLPSGHCFPAGHSSGGFAWIALYFSYQLVFGEKKYSYLLFGLGLGFLFGIDQQIRGAHFLSHDIATLLICWIISGGVAILFSQLNSSRKSELKFSSKKF